MTGKYLWMLIIISDFFLYFLHYIKEFILSFKVTFRIPFLKLCHFLVWNWTDSAIESMSMLKITCGKTSSKTLAKFINLYLWRFISHLLLSVAMNYLHLYYILPQNNKVAFLAKSVEVLSDCIPGNVICDMIWYHAALLLVFPCSHMRPVAQTHGAFNTLEEN